jgi:predicted  nucleic acid-binding Zn-ribbon protein
MLAWGRSDPDLENSASWLWQSLSAQQQARFMTVLGQEAPQFTLPDPSSAVASAPLHRATRALFQRAVEIRKQATPGNPIVCLRHLLAALLTAPQLNAGGSVEPFDQLELDGKSLRRLMLRDLPAWGTRDDRAAWGRLLVLTTDSTLAGRIPRFAAEGLEGPDYLGVEHETEILARYIVARRLDPPLALGVFGEWGAGKSFYMRRMQRHVDKLSGDARKAAAQGRRATYLGGIVQVEFNAWHYGEGNLWASLTAHLFDRLQLAPDDTEKTAEERSQLLTELDKAGGRVLGAELQLRQAEETRAAAEKALEGAQQRAKVAQERADVATLLGAVRQSVRNPVVAQAASEAIDKIRKQGFGNSVSLSPEDITSTVAAVRGVWTRVSAVFRKLWSDIKDPRARRSAWMKASLLVLVPAGAVIFLNQLPGILSQWSAVGGLLGVIGTVGVWIRQLLAQVSGPLQTLEKIEEKAQELADSKSAELRQREAERDQAHKAVEEKREDLNKAESTVKQLNADLERLNPDRRLREFIDARVESDDYRKALGTLALVRRDFERLSKLLQERAVVAPAKSDGALPAERRYGIDRIVLYIDDLDRCSPDRVVDVLQAIHLLLAFPVFVVVVGVDARWVSKALKQRYPWLHDQESDGQPAELPNGPQTRNGARSRAGASPGGASTLDYLEKIFQVPIWLRPLADVELGPLVRGVAHPVEDDRGEESSPAQAASAGGPSVAAGGTPGGAAPSTKVAQSPPGGKAGAAPPKDGVPGGQGRTAPEPSSPEGEKTDMMELSPAEVTELETLAPLYARSPRSVKRLVNSYRLLRALLRPEVAATFLNETEGLSMSRACLEVLAIVVGHPNVGVELLEALLRPGGSRQADAVRESITMTPGSAAANDWHALLPALERLGVMEGTASSLPTYVKAAQLVARFAFRQGRVEPAMAVTASADRPA